MGKLRYPVGMQTFSELIEEGYAYVDKTQYIKPLLGHGKFIFLSRPRRFGKSLMLSTLQSYFEGRRELFKGLAADSMDLDWTPSPVLRFDFNAEDYDKEDGVEQLIKWFLRQYEAEYGRDEEDKTVSQRFKSLIYNAYMKTKRKVVILIDEYDKPLLEIEDNPELLEKTRKTLKSFFGNLKTMDEYIRFAYITGDTIFGNAIILSDLNIKDISMANKYTDICGWSEEELVDKFREGIEKLAESRNASFEQTLLELRTFYDEYHFDAEGTRLYNPYNVLYSLDDMAIKANFNEKKEHRGLEYEIMEV